MAKGNHLDKKKAKAKAEAREEMLAKRKPIKQKWTGKQWAILLMVVSLTVLMLIPLLSGIFDTAGTGGTHDPNLGMILGLLSV